LLAKKKLNKEPLDFKEDREVREYLEKQSFLTREEKKGFDGIYGLLSSGAHGKGDQDNALLGYASPRGGNIMYLSHKDFPGAVR
jgi:hypothetical protein